MADFLLGIQTVATGVIGVLVSGMAGMATAIMANEIVIFAVGVGLMLAGIKFIPRMIGSLRK